MRKAIVLTCVGVVVVVVLVLLLRSGSAAGPQEEATSSARGTDSGPGFGGRGGGGFAPSVRVPMTVELTPVKRADLTEHVMIVGSLVGAQTVDVTPKSGGRLQAVNVRIGASVRRGQELARLEDSEIQEQVRQSEASFAVSQATIRQREADLNFAKTNLDRSRNLFTRQLISQQTLDDAESRFQSATAQLELAQAQFEQSKARLEELKINLSNTIIRSPVDGFVGKRNLDPGAWASTASPVVSVVDIHLVRLVANLVEKDIRRISVGVPATVEVDAYPGETFAGTVARLAPVLDQATRTAQMEIEVPNPGFRLKPGMYARVRIMVEQRSGVLAVPQNAVVIVEGKRGVFVAAPESKAAFRPVETGLQDATQIEIRNGVADGDQVVTTGAAALRDGDTILLPGQTAPTTPGRASGRGAGRAGGGRPAGARAGSPPAGAPRGEGTR